MWRQTVPHAVSISVYTYTDCISHCPFLSVNTDCTQTLDRAGQWLMMHFCLCVVSIWSKRVRTHKPEAGFRHWVQMKTLPALQSNTDSEQVFLLYPWLRLHHVTYCCSRVHSFKQVNWPTQWIERPQTMKSTVTQCWEGGGGVEEVQLNLFLCGQ